MQKRKQSNQREEIAHAVKALCDGGVIAFPTETIYGLGCDPRNAKAVRRIFRLKARDPKKPLLLVASSIAHVRRIATLRGKALRLARQYWPGPLTLVLPVKESNPLVRGIALQGTVAVRISSSSLVQELTKKFGFPLVATSANRSGATESRSLDDVKRNFDDKLDAMIDGGILPLRKASTMLRVREDGSCELIREGAVRVSKKILSSSLKTLRL